MNQFVIVVYRHHASLSLDLPMAHCQHNGALLLLAEISMHFGILTISSFRE